MQHYGFADFLKKVEDLDHVEVLRVANDRCIQVENFSFGRKGAVDRRESGSLEFINKLKGLLSWLHHGRRPNGISEYDFQLIKPLAERLVEKGQLNLLALDEFEVLSQAGGRN